MGGLTKRRLYKPERRAARDKGVFGRHSKTKLAPTGCPDANEGEVAKALYALAREAGVIVGRGSGYDGVADKYTVIGKSMETGKAQDFSIDGGTVADLIHFARVLNGGPMSSGRATA